VAAVPIEIKGTITSFRYRHPESDFLIAEFRTKIDGELQFIGIKGCISEPWVGVTYTLIGRMESSSRYGDTFKFDSYSASLPTEADGVIQYITENCDNVGPERAIDLYRNFGKDTLEVMKDDPARVASTIRGITFERAKKVSDQLRRIESLEGVNVELKKLLKGANYSHKIASELVGLYGDQAVKTLKNEPYEALSHVSGVGFKSADAVALRVGTPPDSELRIKAAIYHVLSKEAPSRGHTALSRRVLLRVVGKLINITEGDIENILDEVIQFGRGSPDKVLVQKDKLISTQRFYRWEREIASWLVRLRDEQPHFEMTTHDYCDLYDDQRMAFFAARNSNVVVITGAPGTGKTHVIKKIVEAYRKAKPALCAPTGKAAKRMTELCGHAASTVHKLLQPKPVGKGKFEFTRNEDCPISAGVVVVDEASMMDTKLMNALIRAVEPGSRLILVGDTYQLPAVGPGNVLGDIIASGVVPCVELTEIKRQRAKSLIVRHCHDIKDGKLIDPMEKSENSDFHFLKREKIEDIVKKIVVLVKRQIPAKTKYDNLLDVQVLSPLRERTDVSVMGLNKALKRALNKELKGQKMKFNVGDKVIQTKNDYERGIINGDIGFVRGIVNRHGEDISATYRKLLDSEKYTYPRLCTECQEDQRILFPPVDGDSYVVEFLYPTRHIHIPIRKNNLQLAYCITVHKYQGSESPMVIVPIHPSLGLNVPQRNWLYTAISRAKKKCLLIGDPEQVAKIIGKCDQKRRVTRLLGMLKAQEGQGQ
jgi:exodeoxyribonuclease V alpha subunit